MFTYFSWIDTSLQEFKPNFDTFVEMMLRQEPQVGGAISVSSLNGLLGFFGNPKGAILELIAAGGEDNYRYYRFPDGFPNQLAALEGGTLLEIGRRWANDEVLEAEDVNNFDICGFLVELQQLCRKRPNEAAVLACAIDP